ncbi:hypothetical protein BX667DRAFT_507656 [Coemansia mojavensis]|nr:hypothetical protein BX667DRAFT_507656 [Coemansia mojavensis]
MAIKVAPPIAKTVKRIAGNAADYIPNVAKHATDVTTYADKAVKLMKRKRAEPKNAAKWADKALEAAVAFEAGLDEELITYTANAAAGRSILRIVNLGMYLNCLMMMLLLNLPLLLSLALKRKRAEDIYIHELLTETLKEIEGRCVLIDPNRRDISYCMHENSTAEDPQLFRYTRNQQSKERQTKRFSNICEKAKTKAVEEAGGWLAEFPSRTLDITEFIEHLQARAQESPILREFYEISSKAPVHF